MKALTADEHVSKIHCVAIRGHSADAPRDILAQNSSDKLILHDGYLDEPFLGLSQEDFKSIGREADIVIRSGANRSFWDHYDKLRGPNVESTKTLANLELQNNAPLHFISSGGVHLLRSIDSSTSTDEEEDYAAASLALSPPSHGWLQRLHRIEMGIGGISGELQQSNKRACAYPPSHPSSRGNARRTTRAPRGDVRARGETAGPLPSPSGWTGPFDLTPADALGADIAAAVFAEKDDLRLQFVHHPAQVKMTMEHVAKYLDMLPAEADLQRLPPLQWAGRAKKEGLSWHFSSTDFITMGGVSGLELRR